MATGLNFQTQTIINSNFDPDSNRELFGILCQKSDEQEKVINVTAADGDSNDSTYGEKLGVKILRDFSIYKDKAGAGKVLAIRRKKGYKAKLCKATIDFTSLTDILVPKQAGEVNYCRLDIYLGIEGAEPYIYSTPWVHKGMPFWIEFTVKNGETAENIVDKLIKMIKQNHIFLCDKDLINVSKESTNKLVLEGATEYQRFKRIDISTFEVDDEYANKVVGIGDTAITINERGENAFGTYSQIVKDLRLPTAANYQWTHIRQVETPIVGAIYDQYIIEYCGPSTNGGMQSVGQRLDSHTTHVFWVKNDSSLISEWEKALKVIDPDGDSLEDENVRKTLGQRVSELESKEE